MARQDDKDVQTQKHKTLVIFNEGVNLKHTAVIFDLDGTLLDTIEDLTVSINIALGSMGYPQHTADDYMAWIGEGLPTLAIRALPAERRNIAEIERFGTNVRDEYRTRWKNHTHPYDGIHELLDGLTRFGIRMSVLSNRPDEFTKLIIDHFLPDWKFEFMAGTKPSVPMKPDPVAAIQIAKDMKTKPKRFAFLGDTKTDMETAIAAGMYPVGVLWGFRGADELRSYGAKLLIERPIDALKIFY